MSCQPCLWTVVHVFPVLLFLVFHVTLCAFIPANNSKITPIKKTDQSRTSTSSHSLCWAALCPHSDLHSEASVLYCNQQGPPSYTKAHSGHVAGPGPPVQTAPACGNGPRGNGTVQQRNHPSTRGLAACSTIRLLSEGVMAARQPNLYTTKTPTMSLMWVWLWCLVSQKHLKIRTLKATRNNSFQKWESEEYPGSGLSSGSHFGPDRKHANQTLCRNVLWSGIMSLWNVKCDSTVKI